MSEVTATAAGASKPIPLDLAQALSPYAQQKGISLRIENLPLRARLSNGHYNGDRSWSLTLDDLAGLNYLPPDGMAAPKTIAVRIIKVDNDHAGTLAVVDVPLSPTEPPSSAPTATAPHAATAGAKAPEFAELQRLQGALAALATTLTERDAALADLRQKLEAASAAPSRDTFDAELAAARASWESALQKRLADAAAEAAATINATRAAGQKELETLRASAEAQLRERLKEAEARWQEETKVRLQKAEATSNAAVAERLATAEASWRAKAAQSLSDVAGRAERAETALAQARAEVTGLQTHAANLQGLRETLTATQNALSAREKELTAARAATSQARDSESADIQAAVEKTEAKWKAIAAQQLAAAEARWQEHLTQMLAEATARFERAEAALAELRAQADPARLQANDVELQRLRDTLVTAQAALAEREAQLAAAQSADPAHLQAKDVELQRLRDMLAMSQAALTEREAQLAAAQSAAESARERALAETQATLREAEKNWNAIAAQRFAAAQTQWREQSERAMAEVTARLKQAETSLAEARGEAQTVREQKHETENSEAELQRLRETIAGLEATLAQRETELAEARAALEVAREQAVADARATSESAKPAVPIEKQEPIAAMSVEPPKAAAKANRLRGSFAKAVTRQRQAQIARQMTYGGALAAAVVAAIILYPRVETLAVGTVLPGMAAMSENVREFALAKLSTPPQAEAEAAPQPRAPEIAQPAGPRWVITAPTANVRAGPSPAANVIRTLPRNVDVTPVERRGSWILIRYGGEGGTRREEGWVASTFLKELANQ